MSALKNDEILKKRQLEPTNVEDGLSLVARLQMHASKRAACRAYVFLGDGDQETDFRTYAEVDQRAKWIATALALQTEVGTRAFLLIPLGLDYLDAFLGCLYSGVIAVPLYEPTPRLHQKLAGIAADSRPSVVLTHSSIRAAVAEFCSGVPQLRTTILLCVDEITAAPTAPRLQDEVLPQVGMNQPAYLQYTAGSTGAPKGVVIQHRNLVDNLRQLHHRLDHHADTVLVSWLPLFHDMGLVIGALLTLYGGGTTILMTPTAFVERPVRWLRAVTRYRGETSAAPNFAYALCSGKLTDADREGLELSSWRTAINGAEPVSAVTLDRFAAAFAPYGLRRETLSPGYGLAESTVAVSVKGPDGGFLTRALDRRALRANRLVDTDASGDSLVLVGCGEPLNEVVIADPERRVRCSSGVIGEIWVRGASVAESYWKKDAESADVFSSRLLDSDETDFLRTGDLGFIFAGQLFITGRCKDLVIIRGKNHYPTDIEDSAKESHPMLRPINAAFSVEGRDEEQLVLVQELRGDVPVEQYGEITAAIRCALVKDHEIRAHTVVLVSASSLPKTTSGKIQRRACWAAFQDGGLKVLHMDALADGELPTGRDVPIKKSNSGSTDREQFVLQYLTDEMALLLGVPASTIDPARRLADLGVDSLRAGELKGKLEVDLDVTISLPELFAIADVRALAILVLERIDDLGRSDGPRAADLSNLELAQ